MKAKKNSSFFAYSLLSIGFGMTLAGTALSVVLPIIFSISHIEMPNWVGLQVRLEPIAKSISSVVKNGYVIGGIEGRLTMVNPTTMVMILSNIIPVLILSSMSYGIFLLRKIIKNVYEGNHFDITNVKNMRLIALLMIIVPHVQVLLQNIIIAVMPKGLIIDGMKVSTVLAGPINIFPESVMPEYILFGLIVFVFAEVFKEGKHLKEENELTV